MTKVVGALRRCILGFLSQATVSCAVASWGCSSALNGPKLEAPARPVVATQLEAPVRPGAARRAHGDAGGLLAKAEPAADDDVSCDRVLDDFSRGPEGGFPEGWETHPGSGLEAARLEGMYRVVTHEGRRVLHARSGSREVTLGLGVKDWDLEQHPIVEWEWKVVVLPQGADESQGGRQDSAAALTAVWMIGLPFVVRRLTYTFSSTLPAGSRVSSRFGYDQLLVADSGVRQVGEWRRVRVNLLENYRAFFDRQDAEAPTGVALTTDAGDTGSRAEAYFANVRLCRPVEVPASARSPGGT